MADDTQQQSRIRVAVRRWSLWWRFQLRAVGRRPAVWRVRWLREPGENVRLAGAQLAIGRLAGRLYLRLLRFGEKARISRARVPDRLEPARATAGLLREQLPLLAALVLLIAIGIALDEAARRLEHPVADALGIHQWFTSTLSPPSPEAVTILLAAVAGGTATILGLVLSISLIAWQATADRYRSTSIVAFLLRERIGSSVVRLLALAFAYSLWVIALYQVLPYRPYVSAAIALALGTVAVVSLISYRRAGLVGYLPEGIASSLSGDMRAALVRARRPHSGRSVQDHARRVIEGDLRIYRDLFGRLVAERAGAEIASSLEPLALFAAHYASVKHELERDSLFFERREERLPPSSAEIEEHLASEGGMNPTMQVPQHYYLERRLAETLREVAAGPMADDPQVAKELFALWAAPLQISWYREDPDALQIALTESERLASRPSVRSSEEIAEATLTIPWLLVEVAGNGLATSAAQIVATRPWDGDRRLRRLPWAAQEDARALGRMIRAEHRIAGGTVTPEQVILAELEDRRRPRLREQQALLCRQATDYCENQVATVKRGDPGGPVIVRMTIRTLLRMTHHGLPLPDIRTLAPQLLSAIAQVEPADRADLEGDTARAARVFAAAGEWDAAYWMLRITAAANLTDRRLARDPMEMLGMAFDLVYLAACIYGWGELEQRSDHVLETTRVVFVAFPSLDTLARILDDHLKPLTLPSITHYRWFQPLTMAVHALPDVPVREGGIGYRVEKDHPSPLIARSDLTFGPDECLEALVDAALEARGVQRERLVLALREYAASLNA